MANSECGAAHVPIAPPGAVAPISWLYVSTELELLWLPNDPPAWRVPAIWSRDPSGKVVAFARLDESVWGWIHARLIAVDRRLAAGESKGLPSREELAVLAERLAVIDGFADERLDAGRMRAALASPPRKLPEPPASAAVHELDVQTKVIQCDS